MTDFKIKLSRAIRKHAPARDFTVEDIPLAKEFKAWFNKNNGSFTGGFPKALAISHSQCDDKPVKMFVVDKEMVGRYADDENGKRTRDNFFWPAQIIVNAEIVEMLPTTLQEINKKTGFLGLKSKKKYVAQENIYNVEDGCMSFPFDKKPKVVQRVNVIKVRYQTITMLGGLKTHEERICGMKSHIFQHEWDHQRNVDVHMKRKPKWIEEPKATSEDLPVKQDEDGKD